MTMSLARRALLVGATSLAWSRPAFASSPIADIEQRHGGRLGVHVAEVGTGRVLSHRADERFTLDSTFKGPLAAFALSRVDSGNESLTAAIHFSRADLLPASPITTAHVEEGRMTIEALCAAMLHVSDNAAANLVMRREGGPQALTAFLRRIGNATTHIDHYEPVTALRSGITDTTTPRAMVQSAHAMLFGEVLTPTSRSRLERWMIENQVGQKRLRASFPAPWIVADRTGTSDGHCNDYAIARAPGRPPLVMAAYYEASGMSTADQEAVLREVGSAIVKWVG